MLSDPKKVLDRIVQNLYEYCIKNNIKNLITGISGGVDSAVVYAICAEVHKLYKDILHWGIFLDCESSEDSQKLAAKVMAKFGEDFRFGQLPTQINMNPKPLFDHICSYTLSSADNKIAYGNVKARLRMIVLYHLANTRNGGQGMVMSTDNLSEYLMGFWTLHGDVGDYGPIQMLWKTEVYDLAEYLNIPKEVIEAKPDDGLGITSGGDEEQLGASYTDIDKIMIHLLEHGFDPDGSMDQLDDLPPTMYSKEMDQLVFNLAKRCLTTSYKRNNPVNIRRDDLGLNNYDQFSS